MCIDHLTSNTMSAFSFSNLNFNEEGGFSVVEKRKSAQASKTQPKLKAPKPQLMKGQVLVTQNVKDVDGFTGKATVVKEKVFNNERFCCKKCKKEFFVDGKFVAYLKSTIKDYFPRTTCQKCKNQERVSKGQAPIPLRPDQEWPLNGQQAPHIFVEKKHAPVEVEVAKVEKKHAPVEVSKVEKKLPVVDDEQSWPSLPVKAKTKAVVEPKDTCNAVVSWADMEEEEEEEEEISRFPIIPLIRSYTS